jgi:hypothetical protein
MAIEETAVAARRPLRTLLIAGLLSVIVLVLVTMVAVGVYVSRSGDPLLSIFGEETHSYPAYVAPEDEVQFESEPSLPGENQPASEWLAGVA